MSNYSSSSKPTGNSIPPLDSDSDLSHSFDQNFTSAEDLLASLGETLHQPSIQPPFDESRYKYIAEDLSSSTDWNYGQEGLLPPLRRPDVNQIPADVLALLLKTAKFGEILHFNPSSTNGPESSTNSQLAAFDQPDYGQGRDQSQGQIWNHQQPQQITQFQEPLRPVATPRQVPSPQRQRPHTSSNERLSHTNSKLSPAAKEFVPRKMDSDSYNPNDLAMAVAQINLQQQQAQQQEQYYNQQQQHQGAGQRQQQQQGAGQRQQQQQGASQTQHQQPGAGHRQNQPHGAVQRQQQQHGADQRQQQQHGADQRQQQQHGADQRQQQQHGADQRQQQQHGADQRQQQQHGADQRQQQGYQPQQHQYQPRGQQQQPQYQQQQPPRPRHQQQQYYQPPHHRNQNQPPRHQSYPNNNPRQQQQQQHQQNYQHYNQQQQQPEYHHFDEFQGPDPGVERVLTTITDIIAHLTTCPGDFNSSVKKAVRVLQESLYDADTLGIIITLIVEQSIANRNFSYTGAKLCQALNENKIMANGLTIMDALIRGVEEVFKAYAENISIGSVEIKEREIGLLFFLAELFMNYSLDQGKKFFGFGVAALEIMTNLITTKPNTMLDHEKVKHVVQVLKLAGWELENHSNSKLRTDMEKLMKDLSYILVMSENVAPQTKEIVQRIIDLKKRNWDHEQVDSSASGAGQQASTTAAPAPKSEADGPTPNTYNGKVQHPVYELPESEEDELLLDDEPEEVNAFYEEFLRGLPQKR